MLAGIYHREDPWCKLCKDAPEKIQHITAVCKMLGGRSYIEHHNQGAQYTETEYAEYGLEAPRSKWEMLPRVVEKDQAKILLDFRIQMDRLVMANHRSGRQAEEDGHSDRWDHYTELQQ